LRALPWLLVGLPLQLLGYEITTTPIIGLGLLGIVAALVLYRTTAHNEMYLRLLLLAGYSLGIGVIAQFDLHGLYMLQHLSWVVVIVSALHTVARTAHPVPASTATSAPEWYWWSAVAGVGIVAAVIRAHGIETAPVIGGDEANAALYGLEVLNGTVRNLFQSGWYEFPALWFSLPALSHAIFADPMWALRGHAVLIGALSCATLTWALRPMLASPWYAVAGGLLLACFGLHINFSQIGLNNIFDGLTMTILLGLLARQSEQYAPMRWGWIGVWLGIALYGYTSARLFPLIIALWAVRMWWHRPTQRGALLDGMAVIVTMALIVLAPLLVHYVYRPDNFQAPLMRLSYLSDVEPDISLFARIERDTGVSVWSQLWQHVIITVKAISVGPTDGWYVFSRGVVGPVLVIPLLIGARRAIDALHRPMWHVTVAGVIGFIVVSVLSHPVGSGQRLIALMPLLIVLCLLGMQWLARLLQRWIPPLLATGMVVMILGASMYTHLNDYFEHFLWREGGVGDVNSRVVDYYGQFMRRLPPGTVVDILIGPDFQRAANVGVAYHARHLDALEIPEGMPMRPNAQVWVIAGSRLAALPPMPGLSQAQYVVMPEGTVWLTIRYVESLHPFVATVPHQQLYPPSMPAAP